MKVVELVIAEIMMMKNNHFESFESRIKKFGCSLI